MTASVAVPVHTLIPSPVHAIVHSAAVLPPAATPLPSAQTVVGLPAASLP